MGFSKQGTSIELRRGVTTIYTTSMESQSEEGRGKAES